MATAQMRFSILFKDALNRVNQPNSVRFRRLLSTSASRMTIDFYYVAPSPPCRAVLMVAKDMDIPLNLKVVDLFSGEHLKPDFLKLNPQHTVPVLVDGDLILAESRAIMAYLVNQYSPGHKLYPSDPKVRASIERFLYFEADQIVPAQRNLHRPVVFGGQDKPSDEALKTYHEKLTILNTMLDGKKYLVGDNRTLADVSIYAMLGMGAVVNFDFSGFPNVKKWQERIAAEMPYDEEINKKPVQELVDMVAARKAAAAQ